MQQSLQLTRNYLIAIAVFVLGRFGLELAGAPQGWTDEISVTRLLFVIPVFVGLRLASQGLQGAGQLLLANAVYVIWAIGLVMAVTTIDILLGLHTHFGHGRLGPHLLGHVAQMAYMIPVTALICWVSYRINSR